MSKHLRITLALALAAALAPAAARAASSSRSGGFGNHELSLGAPIGGLDFSGLLSLEFPPSGFDVGPRLSGEIMYSALDLAPNVRLKVGGRAAFAYHSWSPNGSLWAIDAVPDVKIVVALSELVALYGDVGLGLGVLHISNDFGYSDSTVALTFQVGGGIAYALNRQVSLLGEVRADIYTRSGSSTFVTFPTVGLLFH